MKRRSSLRASSADVHPTTNITGSRPPSRYSSRIQV
jgi:hypothetical protein